MRLHHLLQIVFVIETVSSLPSPQTSVHVRFSSLPIGYSHTSMDIPSDLVSTTFRTPDSLSRRSAVLRKVHRMVPGVHSRTSREFVAHNGDIAPNPEDLWPNGVFLQPNNDMLALIASRNQHHNVYHDFVLADEDPDPLLISGAEAVAMLKFIFSKGPLFYEDVPHARALLRNQELRRANGLNGNLLGSNRPESVFYRWKHLHGNHQKPHILPFFPL